MPVINTFSFLFLFIFIYLLIESRVNNSERFPSEQWLVYDFIYMMILVLFNFIKEKTQRRDSRIGVCISFLVLFIKHEPVVKLKVKIYLSVAEKNLSPFIFHTQHRSRHVLVWLFTSLFASPQFALSIYSDTEK